jgi:hypothetical protein
MWNKNEFFQPLIMKVVVFSFLLSSVKILAQDTRPLVQTDDTKYFDFWEGTWCVVKDDNTLDTASYFIVKRGVNPAAFEEKWQFSVPEKIKSTAVRVWDKTNNKWGFVWVSSNGLFQVWDSKKIDGHWYIYRQFIINGDTYLSRQGFLPQADGTVLRISEKTYDEKKWELRFKQRLKKIK